MEAVVELLSEDAKTHPLLRERYVDALSRVEKWPEVVEIICDVEPAQLSRRELEHGVFALAMTDLSDRASDMITWHQSEYDDNAARVFRREMSRQHPEIGRDDSGGQS